MKIIVTYASAGTGHRRAAEAIYNYFKDNCPACDLKIIDALEKTNPLFKNLYTCGYLFLVNNALWLWQIGFWLTYVKRLRPFNRIAGLIINRLNAKNLAEFLIRENPDCIIATHFFPSEIAAYLKRGHKINSRIVTVITDFGIHPFWIQDATDIYIAASGFTKEQLVFEGVKENSIKDLGIPIDSKFLNRYEKAILYKKFNIEPDKFTVLIVTGSFGIGKIEQVVDLLHKDAQILAVCANNGKLYARLKKKNYPRVKVFGFIDNIQELMAISDIIVTKPGGLTISECLAMELLPIFITAIPGQETENIKSLARESIGINVRNIALIRDTVLDFKKHPDKVRHIKEKISKVKKPFAAKELYGLICQGGFRVTG